MNVMKCSRCGNPVHAAAAFCPHCGQPLHPVAPAATTVANATLGATALQQAYDQQKRRNAIIGTVLGILALVVIGIGLKASGVLGSSSDRPDKQALNAVHLSPNRVLDTSGSTPPPVLNNSAQRPADVKMPDDVYAWLEHLRKTEEARHQIVMGQLAESSEERAKLQVSGGADAIQGLINGIDDPNSEMKPPTEGLARMLKKMHDETTELIGKFESFPPPAECVPIHDSYAQALDETAGLLGDFADHLAANDLNFFMGMKGKSSGTIDAPGKKADRLVGEICEKYHTRRWFSISSDIGSNSIFSSGF